MLQIIFGDDEHTAADGPYSRLLKTRKWLYLTSVAHFTVTHGLYNEAAAGDLLKIVKAPTTVIEPALSIGLTYLLVQYLLLITQLVTSYDIVLGERFTNRRAEEIASAFDRLSAARKTLATAQTEAEERAYDIVLRAEQQVSSHATELSTQLIAAQVTGDSQGDASYEKQRQARYEIGRLRARVAAANKALTDRVESRSGRISALVDADTEVSAALVMVQECDHELSILKRKVPANRFGYRNSEAAIDFIRVSPPAIISAFLLWSWLAS